MQKIELIPSYQLRHNDIVITISDNTITIIGIVTKVMNAGITYENALEYIESLRRSDEPKNQCFCVKHPLTGDIEIIDGDKDNYCHVLRDVETVVQEVETKEGIVFVDYIDDDGRRKGTTVPASKFNLETVDSYIDSVKQRYVLITMESHNDSDKNYKLNISYALTQDDALEIFSAMIQNGVIWMATHGVDRANNKMHYWFIDAKDVYRIQRTPDKDAGYLIVELNKLGKPIASNYSA